MCLRKFIIVGLLLLAMKAASAQAPNFQFGAIKGGLNLTTAHVNDASAIKFKLGYHIGVTGEYRFSSKFELQTGLYLSAKGSKIIGFNSGGYVGGSPSNYSYTFNPLYLTLPLYATLVRKNSNNVKTHIGLGPYFGYGIGGKTRRNLHNGSIYSDRSTEINWDTFGNGIFDNDRPWLIQETLNRFDFGVGFNFDREHNRFIYGIGLEFSIIDVLKKTDYNSQRLSYRNINIMFSTGYRFGL